jgi:hypothetical protein
MFRILILVILFSLNLLGAEKPQTIECPLKMPVNFKPVKMIPTFQFRDAETDEIEFVSLAMFDQDPKKNMQLKPDNGDAPPPHTWTIKPADAEKKDDNTPNWQQPADAAASKTIIPWLACYYGKNSKQVFVKRFAKIPQSCTTKASKTNPKIFNTVVCN